MARAVKVLDAYVDAARTLCARPSIEAAVGFWLAEQQVRKKVAGELPWEVVRALLVERYGPAVLSTVTQASQLRSLQLAAPGSKPAAPPVSANTTAAGTRHGRLPIRSR